MKFRFLAVALAGVLAAAAAVAKPPHNPPPPSHPASLEQAVKQVQHQTGGHILAADTVSRGRTQVYRIKVLKKDGQVQVMQLRSSPQSQSRQSNSSSNNLESDQGGH
ncbi:MAG TPA: hypothetical protein VF284_10010 [Rhodanobacteraceae bacterium]